MPKARPYSQMQNHRIPNLQTQDNHMKIINLLVALLAAVSFSGCGHSDHKDAPGHDDHIPVSAYADGVELFAEVTPLVTGDECVITAHLTGLADFKPVGDATLTATLTSGGKSASATATPTDHKGIYKLTLTPAAAGDATLSFEVKSAVADTRLTVGDLKVFDDDREAEEFAEESMPHSSNAVPFTKAMSWKVKFSTVPVSRRPMSQVITTMGKIQPSQGDVRTIVAKAAGIVNFARPDLTDGTAVSAGQTLFTIDASSTADNNLRARQAEAKSNYATARADYEQKRELADSKLITRSELLQAENAMRTAEAAYEAVTRGFGAGGTAASSPIGGFITSLDVTNGQYIEAGQPLATVAANRDLFIKAEVEPSLSPLLDDITGANMRRPNSGRIYSLSDLNGSVVSHARSVADGNPLLPVVFRVNNAAGLVPGTFVEMFIQAGPSANVISVPANALIEEMGNNFVYVQLTPELFEKREVTVGRTDGEYAELTSGVADGERVVADGAVLVKLAHASGTLDAHSGHVH